MYTGIYIFTGVEEPGKDDLLSEEMAYIYRGPDTFSRGVICHSSY